MDETNELEPLTEEQKDKIETTLNSRVKKISLDVKEIKNKTNSMLMNGSPHGVATISISLFIAAERYFQAGDYKNAILFFVAGSFMYLIQNALMILKVKLGDGKISDITKENVIVRTVGEATGFYRKQR